MARGNGNGARLTRWTQTATILIAVGALVFANIDAASLRSDIDSAQHVTHTLRLEVAAQEKALHQVEARFFRLIRRLIHKRLQHQDPRAAAYTLASSMRPRYCWGKKVTIYGTPGDDSFPPIVGTNGPDVIHALGGNDQVFGDGGNDTICGGRGNDNLVGDPGTDHISGGPGNDACVGEVKRKCEQ